MSEPVGVQIEDRARFIRNVVHDLRAPIRAIVQHAALIREHIDNGDPTLKPLLTTVSRAAMRLDRMLSGLRKFHEALGVPGAEIPLRAVIESTTASYSDRGIKITIEDGDATPIPAPIGVVLGNLLDNSAKYGARTVHIRAKVTEHGYVDIEVSDDGIGFDPDARERIFDTFSRTESAQQIAEGEGIGLAICRELVERIGGRIWADSEGHGKGCVFHISVPIGPPPQKAPGEATILVVDDEKVVRGWLKQFLKPYGEIVVAESMTVALGILAHQAFDLVLVDLRLGDGSGDDLVESIRRRSAHHLCRVVLMSGFGDQQEGDALARSCGANGFLMKPITWEVLHARLQILDLYPVKRP